MPHHIHIKTLTPPRAWLLTAAAILGVALTVAGCGSSSSSSVAIDHEGAIFALSATIMQSPAFERAAAICNLR
jgi:hypothetical protein